MERTHLPLTTSTLINRAAVIRLYPNREQAAALRRWQGGLRFVWNNTWAWCKEQRETAGKWPNKAAIQNRMVGLKKQQGTEWIADIPAHAILTLADDMARAMKNWFEKRAKMPKFRGKFQRAFSVYAVNQATKFIEQRVKLPKLGDVRFKAGDLPEGSLLSSRIYRDADKWFMSSVFECQPFAESVGEVERVGIDMGIKTLATVFDGEKIVTVENPKALDKHLARLRRYQRRVSRRVKGSNRREDAKRRVARLHQKIANIRKDAQHKATSAIVKMADTIVVESLNVKGMMKAKLQSKAIADAGMGEFLRQLKYKAAWHSRTVIEADRFFPSSQICFACGEIHKEMAVKRLDVLRCDCGNVMQRDENASRNLFAYREGLGNAGGKTPKTRMEIGDQEQAAMPVPVPVSEVRISKRITHHDVYVV